jgi:hypothetical protein
MHIISLGEAPKLVHPSKARKKNCKHDHNFVAPLYILGILMYQITVQKKKGF